jgi:hypothetical protein
MHGRHRVTQAKTIEKAVGEFGASAKAKLAGGDGQPEDQLRAPLETLFAEVAAILHPAVQNLVLTGETSLAEMRTRPDYAVKVKNALVGFIEVKAPGKGADPRKWKTGHDKEQWDKLKALPNLLYTDGDSFSLWRDGVLVGQIVHLDGGIEQAGAKLAAPQTFLPLLSDFLTWNPIPPRSATELARVSARLCRFLRDEVLEQLGASEKNARLTDLKDDWKALLFPDADDEKFADGYAQAVTFGLLMAKSKDMALTGGLDHVARELGKANTLIGTALRLLTEQDLNLGPALDTLTRVLDEVSWAKVSKGDPEAWLYFYEDFLEVYDNKLRKLTGSYYTPPEVVRTMVRLCDEALKSPRFGIADGLAGKDVHIVDPATGSGTFLLGLIERIKATIAARDGEGNVAASMNEIAGRLVGFELQFGAFAVAQLRLLAEMLEIGANATPRLFVTDTLGDPFADLETGQGIYREISKSRTEANKVKRSEPITVVIGNPPYKEKAKGKGAWVENGSPAKQKRDDIPLNSWQPPKEWKVGAHAKHLRNLYVYFWRWAAWKVFEQGAGDRDDDLPGQEELSGMVCYITVAGFLNGDGFQKMRADLRGQCDDIWVIDCTPEGHQPDVPTRIFQGVQHPVCIVLASRSREPGKDAARVRYRALAKGRREQKFEELKSITLAGGGWSDCPSDPRAPFLPELREGWGAFAPLDAVIGDCGSGVMPGRTWIIAPDEVSLKQRWKRLVEEPKADKRAMLFQPHMRDGKPGDRHIGKSGKALWWPQREVLTAVEDAPKQVDHEDQKLRLLARRALAGEAPVRYGFRSFDRQYILPDARVINQPNPGLWDNYSDKQIFLSALMAHSPKSGPAISATALIPDLHQYKGSFGGRVFALWKNAAATESNISPTVIALLSKAFGGPVDPVDIFAYVAALLAHPAYTASFAEDLVRPGLRVPLTADAALFAEAAKLGREVIRLHTFGERFATEDPPRPPRVGEGGPTQPKDGAIPSTPEGFPDTLEYDAAKRRLLVGTGFIDNVPPAVWAYEVSGKQVLRQWFSYRRKNRERPLIGDKRPPSPLGDIQPDRWLPEYTSELINVLNVLALLVELEPKQADLMKSICDGPLIPASKLTL